MEKDNFKDILISHFDDDALKQSDEIKLKNYGSRDNDEFLRAPYEYIENNLLKNINEKNVLDYCCGSGLYSVIPALKKANVFGVDISDKSIEVAKKRAEILKISNRCNFIVGDAEELEFDDNFFDVILSYGSLSYLDLDKSFKELKRVLKQDGILIIVDSLGYNPILNHNRRKNIRNYASNYVDQLMTLTHKDLDLSLKYFNSYTIKYFDMFTLMGSLLNSKYGFRFEPSRLIQLDNFFLKIPIINRLSFKFVCVIQ